MAAAHASLGDLAARAKNSEAAERHYRDALAADAHHSAAHLNLGSLLFNAGRVEAAERHFRVAARLEPRSPASLNNLGNVRFAQQKFEEAYRLFQRARDLDPSNATIYRNLGAVQLKLGLHEESLDSYSTCFQLAPDLSDVLLDLAEVHYARRDFGRALEMSEEFVRRAPHCGRGFAKMGRCYEAMNQPLAALASYECAARIDPSFRLPAERISHLRETLELREAPDSKK
jgi:tetratricopeptide (TPR) repeat protein